MMTRLPSTSSPAGATKQARRITDGRTASDSGATRSRGRGGGDDGAKPIETFEPGEILAVAAAARAGLLESCGDFRDRFRVRCLLSGGPYLVDRLPRPQRNAQA